jgi:Domain of unknown function (DUF4375)
MAVTLGDIIEKFAYCENGGDPEVLDEWLDEWLWQIKDADATYKSLPDPIRYVWAGRHVQWQVGNGGFAQAAFNCPHLLEDAKLCYLALGRPVAAALIETAIMLVNKGEAEFNDNSIGELFEDFQDSEFAKLDEDLESAGWWATEDRVKYSLQHKELFLKLKDGVFASES